MNHQDYSGGTGRRPRWPHYFGFPRGVDVQTVGALVVAMTLTACGGTRENDEATLSEGSLDLAIEQLTDATVVSAATNMATEVETLRSEIASFCSSPDADSLSGLQSQWQNTALAWYQLLPFNLGPLDDDLVFPNYQFIDSYRLRGTDYTETIRTDIDGWLVSDDTLDGDFFAGLAFNKVGLLALEVGLFETAADQDSTAAEVLSEFVNQPRKCDVIDGLAEALERRTDDVRDDWTVSYGDNEQSYRDLFLAGELEDGSTPLVTLLTGVQEYLDYLDQRDVVNNVAQLSASDSFDRWSLMTASMDSIEAILAGATTEQVSLFELMTAGGNASSVATVESNIAAAREAISSLDSTSFNALAATLDGNFKRDIPDSLDVSLGINFSDGD